MERPIRQVRQGRRAERGIVLVAALVLALVYFALMELMLIDSSRTLREAERFRARVLATTLAENGAELAADKLVTQMGATVTQTNGDGQLKGTMQQVNDAFIINGRGVAGGVLSQEATVRLQGRIDKSSGAPRIVIDWAQHSQ